MKKKKLRKWVTIFLLVSVLFEIIWIGCAVNDKIVFFLWEIDSCDVARYWVFIVIFLLSFRIVILNKSISDRVFFLMIVWMLLVLPFYPLFIGGTKDYFEYDKQYSPDQRYQVLLQAHDYSQCTIYRPIIPGFYKKAGRVPSYTQNILEKVQVKWEGNVGYFSIDGKDGIRIEF